MRQSLLKSYELKVLCKNLNAIVSIAGRVRLYSLVKFDVMK